MSPRRTTAVLVERLSYGGAPVGEREFCYGEIGGILSSTIQGKIRHQRRLFGGKPSAWGVPVSLKADKNPEYKANEEYSDHTHNLIV